MLKHSTDKFIEDFLANTYVPPPPPNLDLNRFIK